MSLFHGVLVSPCPCFRVSSYGGGEGWNRQLVLLINFVRSNCVGYTAFLSLQTILDVANQKHNLSVFQLKEEEAKGSFSVLQFCDVCEVSYLCIMWTQGILYLAI